MNYEAYFSELTQCINEILDIDFGYPLDDNKVFPPLPKGVFKNEVATKSNAIPEELMQQYRYFNGLSFPDVHNGYFIMSLDRLFRGITSTEPRTIHGKWPDSIVVFGSTGGGKKFAYSTTTKQIYLLGHGEIDNQVFHSDEGNVQVIAKDLDTFFNLLLNDLKEFIEDNPDHKFISD